METPTKKSETLTWNRALPFTDAIDRDPLHVCTKDAFAEFKYHCNHPRPDETDEAFLVCPAFPSSSSLWFICFPPGSRNVVAPPSIVELWQLLAPS